MVQESLVHIELTEDSTKYLKMVLILPDPENDDSGGDTQGVINTIRNVIKKSQKEITNTLMTELDSHKKAQEKLKTDSE